MRVYLIRHAKAERRDAERWPDDSLRPLSPRGRERFEAAAAALSRPRDAVDVVLASPYRRAWQTAELLATHAGWPAPTSCPPLASASIEAVVAAAEAATRDGAERVALVGHEPQMSALASWLLTGDQILRFRWRTGAIARLEVERWAPGAATLEWFAQPRLLAR
ncbi:MAG: histidine phosphatase family protein [Dehalococcoidia bacterium]